MAYGRLSLDHLRRQRKPRANISSIFDSGPPANVNTGAGPTRAAAAQQGAGGGGGAGFANIMSAMLPMLGGMMGGGQQQQQMPPVQRQMNIEMPRMQPLSFPEMRSPLMGGQDVDMNQVLALLLANGSRRRRGPNFMAGA